MKRMTGRRYIARVLLPCEHFKANLSSSGVIYVNSNLIPKDLRQRIDQHQGMWRLVSDNSIVRLETEE